MAAIIGSVGEFRDKEDSWKNYIARLNQFFVANDVDNINKKKAILLSCVGAKMYKLMCSLAQPKEPHEHSYDELVTLVTNHQSPKPSKIVQRFKFNSRVRKSEESVRTYVAELRKLSEHCDYGDQLTEMLRDRLVCGINDVRIQTKLLSEKDLKFEQAFEIATAMETAKENSQSINSAVGVNHSVHYLNKSKEKHDSSRSSSSFKVKSHDKNKHCFRCGNAHDPKVCKYKEMKCYGCDKIGHPKFNCKSLAKDKDNKFKKRVDKNYDLTECDISEELYGLFTLVGTTSAKVSHTPLVSDLCVDDVTLPFQVDTGAALTVMSKGEYDKHFSKPLRTSSKILRTYTGDQVSVAGEVDVEVMCTSEGVVKKVLPLLVVNDKGPNLLGRNWLCDIRIDWSLFLVKTNDGEHKLENVLHEYDEVFKDDPGVLQNVLVDLHVDKDVKPIFLKARQPPISMKKGIEEELDRLQRNGIIEPVKFSKWATPIVPILKSDGSVRICGDYKSTLNKVAPVENHPIPLIEDMANQLAGGETFTKVDFSHAYTQLKLSEEAKVFTTINTHKGLFRYNRLCFGIASAPAIFQRTLEQLFSGVDCCRNYIDDLYITGRNEDEHIENVKKVLKICKENGLTIRRSKCEFMKEVVHFLGYKLSKEGLQPLTEKVKAVKDFPEPKDKNHLRSYLGLINYYGKFVKNMSGTLKPLYDLLKSNQPFVWGSKEKQAFVSSKAALVSDKILAHFNPNLKTILTCDGSPYGVGAILSQIDEHGVEKPVCYASKTLTKAEQNYSQTDREGLSVIFAVKKWHKYIWGRHVQIRTDHKPLLGTFGKGIPEHASARVQRWATLLTAYSYDLVYVPGTANVADILSRMPLGEVEPEAVPPEVHSLFNFIENSLVKAQDIAQETVKDPILAKVLYKVKHGWSKSDKNDEKLKSFYIRKDELSIDNECILWGVRVIIPTKLRKTVLDMLHDTHIGSARMKSQARSWMWWPNMDSEIEAMVKACFNCQLHSNKPCKSPLMPWEWPEEPWQRLHLDFAGPFLGKMFLIICDAHSKWLDVRIMSKITASETILELRDVFSVMGLCREIVTDNGPTFTSDEFGTFLSHNGIKHITVSPYHPASNGLAERNVQTFKKGMIKNEKGTIRERVCRFLTRYRSLPHCTTGLSPSELLFGRKMRTHLDLLHPSLMDKVCKQQESQKVQHDKSAKERELHVGDQVLAQNFSGRGEKWVPGMLIEKSGPYSFTVKTMLGIWRRHVDQLKLLIVDTEDSNVASVIMPELEETGGDVSTTSQRVSESGEGETVECRIDSKNDESVEVEVNPEVVEVEVKKKSDVSSEGASDQISVSSDVVSDMLVPEVRRSSRASKPVVKMNLYLS